MVMNMKKVCIVGISGKLGHYMAQHALERGYEVVGVCRERSVGKLDALKGLITVFPGATDDRSVIKKAVEGCDGVLTVLAPMGVHHYATGTAQAVLDYADPSARLIFSTAMHVARDDQDVYTPAYKMLVKVATRIFRLLRVVDFDDQVEACMRVFASNTRWTVVRAGSVKEGESQGMPLWRKRIGGPVSATSATHRVDFSRFMIEALENDELIHEAPAIASCQTASAHAVRAEK